MNAVRLVVFSSWLAFAVAGLANAQTDAQVQQPRAFGYVLGDVLRQRVLLEIEGEAVQPIDLPRAERVGPWLERRAARLERHRGAQWLVVEYQLINAPQTLRTIAVPEWWIDAGGGRALRVPEWLVSIAPLTPRAAFGVGALRDLRPDRVAPRVDTALLSQRLFLWLGALLVTLLAWGAWLLWRNWRASMQQPFARALRHIRKIGATSPQAWEALHAAFDQTAGRVVHAQILPVLFERAPHLRSEQRRIEAFFAASTARFFADAPAEPSVSLHALCADLRRLEKRHES